jgi:uncharacterized membrane protein AbrB (regulator of aidB expression)
MPTGGLAEQPASVVPYRTTGSLAGVDLDLVGLAIDHPQVPLAFILGCLLLGALVDGVAVRRGWPRLPAVLAACGLALALAVTVVRPGVDYEASGWGPIGVARVCAVGSFSLSNTYERLNVAMLVPFALFGTFAVRRPAALVAASVLLSGTVEYVQSATGGGTCQLRDIAHNTSGAALAVALGWGWLRARESSRESRRRGRTAIDAPGR